MSDLPSSVNPYSEVAQLLANAIDPQTGFQLETDRECVKHTITFAGGTTNDPGDYDGTGTPFNLFTVTGDCLVAVIGVVTTLPTGASGTLSVGTATVVAKYIPTTVGTTMLLQRIIDHTGLVAEATLPLTNPTQAATNGEEIVGTVATADLTAGVIDFYCFFRPLSAGATVVAG